ncbi:TPA: hypothetical protein ACM2ZS_005058 [Pseudomonas aeruginosa]|nr:hypothetical protein [Pseudomonas aeruginosa]
MEQFFILPEPVMAIRSKYYIGVLLHRLGVKRVGHIPSALDRLAGVEWHESYDRYRCDFYRYRKGENIKNAGLEKSIDEILPGTARILHHPIWSILSKYITEKEELIQLAQGVEPGLQQYILKHDESTRDLVFRDYSGRGRILRAGSPFLQMIDRRGLDELAALLLIMRAHELRGAYSVSRAVRETITEFFAEISLMEEFSLVVAEMYMQVHRLFIGNTYKNPSKDDGLYDYVQAIGSVYLEHMLDVIERLGKRRMNHNGEYSYILRGKRQQ